jgi:hypothetical protein
MNEKAKVANDKYVIVNQPVLSVADDEYLPVTQPIFSVKSIDGYGKYTL